MDLRALRATFAYGKSVSSLSILKAQILKFSPEERRSSKRACKILGAPTARGSAIRFNNR